MVASRSFMPSNLFFRPFFGGRKPSNKNLSVGRPDDTRAEITAVAPGTDVILISFFSDSLTIL